MKIIDYCKNRQTNLHLQIIEPLFRDKSKKLRRAIGTKKKHLHYFSYFTCKKRQRAQTLCQIFFLDSLLANWTNGKTQKTRGVLQLHKLRTENQEECIVLFFRIKC